MDGNLEPADAVLRAAGIRRHCQFPGPAPVWDENPPEGSGSTDGQRRAASRAAFGLRVSSSTPQITFDFPANFFQDFKNLPGILLAMNAPLPSNGKPVVGIGLIPVGDGVAGHDGVDPNTGRATTAAGYYLPTQGALSAEC